MKNFTEEIPEDCPLRVQGTSINNTEINTYEIMTNALTQKAYTDLSTVIEIATAIYNQYKERREAQNEAEVLRILREINEKIDAATNTIIRFLRDMHLQDIINDYEYVKRKWAEYQPKQENYSDLKEIIDINLRVYSDLIP